MKNKLHCLKLCAPVVGAVLAATAARAVDFHVATAQDLQNAFTLAASDGANNNIYLTNGYYIGNFNYNSSGGYNLTVTNEPGVTNTQIFMDGGGLGGALSITSTGTSAITVSSITFSRNCGNNGIGALSILGGAGSVIWVNGCQFLSPANSVGSGLVVNTGLNTTITNCVTKGTGIPNSGVGVSVSGVTGTVNVSSCLVASNSCGIGEGYGVNISGAGTVNLLNNIITGNGCGGSYCSDTTITVISNNFTGNVGSGANFAGATTLTGNAFYSNTGGGASINGAATLIGNSFYGNINPNANGGGAILGGGPATLTGNSFIGNTAGNAYGGGVLYIGASVALTNNTFNGNFAGNSASVGGGAAVAVYPSVTASFTGNTFTGNSATVGFGGGIYCYSQAANTITVLGNTFQQNNASMGGAIYVSSQTINFLDNLIIANSQTGTTSQGGGVWVDATSNLFFINNTITGNTAAGSGGGAAFEATGTVELLNVYNNIIWGNTANGSGGDVWLAGTGQKKVFDFNDADSIYGVWDIALNNIDLSPQFFDPVNGDYHTQSTSPCANVGTNGAPSLPLTDLDGNSRTNSAGLVDMGCYEFNTTATHPADVNGDFIITPAEFNAYSVAWQNGLTWTNGPNPIPANYVTRAGYLMTNGGAYYNAGSARPVNWKLIGH